jgi:hypothetical protein
MNLNLRRGPGRGGLGEAFGIVQELLAETGLPPDDLYVSLGADPTDAEGFLSAVRSRWDSAMAAALGDFETARSIFGNALYQESLNASFPQEDTGPGDIFAQNPLAAFAQGLGYSDDDIMRMLVPGFFAGEAGTPAAEEEVADIGPVINPQYENQFFF